MSWQERLEKASWRDVGFLTEAHEAREGQRLVVHELPGRDGSVVEDFGARPQKWQVSAYFIGTNYDIERNKFLSALRKSGADWLVHPWLGRVWARAENWSISETTKEGGFAKIQVDFINGGGDVPLPLLDLSDAAAAAVANYQENALANAIINTDPSVLAIISQRAQAAMDNVRKAFAMARLPLTMMEQVNNSIAGVKGLIAEGLGLPLQYINAFLALSQALRLPSLTIDLGDRARVRLVAALRKEAMPTPLPAVYSTSSIPTATLQAALNAEQIARQHFVASLVLSAALADYSTVPARDAAMENALRTVEGLLPVTTEQAMYQAALDARLAVQKVLVAQLPIVEVSRNVYHSLPAIVVAHQMGADEAVFAERNGVSHPLFVRGVVYG